MHALVVDADLLVKGDLLHVRPHFVGQVGLPGANRSGSAQSQVVVEAMAKGAPCVK